MHYICASEYLNICVVFVCVEYYHCVALQMPVLIKKEKEKVLCCKRLLLFRFFRPLWLFASRSVTSLHLGFKSTHIPPEFGGLQSLVPICSHQRSEELSLIEQHCYPHTAFSSTLALNRESASECVSSSFTGSPKVYGRTNSLVFNYAVTNMLE